MSQALRPNVSPAICAVSCRLHIRHRGARGRVPLARRAGANRLNPGRGRRRQRSRERVPDTWSRCIRVARTPAGGGGGDLMSMISRLGQSRGNCCFGGSKSTLRHWYYTKTVPQRRRRLPMETGIAALRLSPLLAAAALANGRAARSGVLAVPQTGLNGLPQEGMILFRHYLNSTMTSKSPALRLTTLVDDHIIKSAALVCQRSGRTG